MLSRVVCLFGCLLVVAVCFPTADETLIRIPGIGTVKGSYSADKKVIQWFGIPYAAPPIGGLRFAEPRPADPWGDKVLMADSFKPGCPQNCTLMKLACPVVTNEDCLYLNIWAPSASVRAQRSFSSNIQTRGKSSKPSNGVLSKPQSKTTLHPFSDDFIPLNLFQESNGIPPQHYQSLAPVYVFIHGGMFTLGHGGTHLLDGTRFAEEGIVVVTFNYRLGALGFLSVADIPGNFGFLDQTQLLHWVQAHIASFGGDPEMVTLGGQSAGANSVALHLTSQFPNKTIDEPLFHRVVMESPLLGLPLLTQQQAAYEIGSDFAYRLGCDSTSPHLLDCLRNVTTEEIVAAQSIAIGQVSSVRKLFGSPYFSSLILPWSPVISGPIVDQPLSLIRAGQWKKTPAIAGFTKDEFASFTPTLVPELGRYSYSALVYAYFGLHVSGRILEEYPASDEIPDQRDVISQVTRDMFVACPLRQITHNNTFPAFLYRFDHVFNDSRLWAEYSDYCAHFACHSSELAAAFAGKFAANQTAGMLTEDETHGADQLHRYFSRFIREGDPNNVDDFPWPKSVGPGPYLRMDTPYTITPAGVDPKRCDLWDEIGYFW